MSPTLINYDGQGTLVSVSARRFMITGSVQGVFYRAQARVKADELGLTGWVRNTEDGGVEIHAEGPADKLKELEQWCWQGPPRAMVENVRVTATPDRTSTMCESFEIVS